MSEKKYNSVLVGYADEPRYNDDGKIGMWGVKFKDSELKEMIEKYATRRERS